MEPIVLALIEPEGNTIRTAQHFLGYGRWETSPMIHSSTLAVTGTLPHENLYCDHIVPPMGE